MSEQPTRELFLGRQPILDRNENLAAYELLFRSGHFNGAQIEDDTSASATVINHAFEELGVEAVLGKHTGFINLTAPLILSDPIELLPKDKVGLEILEKVKVTDQLVQRCRELKEAGFTLALDDFTGQEAEFKPLLEIVDIVKVDVQNMSQAALAYITGRLKRYNVRLLAEKVDTREQVDRCLDLGYELFQGYYFAKPSIITGKRLSHADAALMRLLELVLTESPIQQIEALFRQTPDLSFNLLQLVNSAATGTHKRITSLSDAIAVLGRKHLQRWLQLLLFTLSSAPRAEFPSPLLILAATRGKLMELIARALSPADRDSHHRAFMTGILSLVHARLAMPMREIVGPLPIDAEVKCALLDRTGALGHMLLLVEALEESDLMGIETALDRVPGLEHGQVIGLQVEAMGWANAIAEPG
jgi:EAL and modified HD-GYP domain-containing signal transduction protein